MPEPQYPPEFIRWYEQNYGGFPLTLGWATQDEKQKIGDAYRYWIRTNPTSTGRVQGTPFPPTPVNIVDEQGQEWNVTDPSNPIKVYRNAGTPTSAPPQPSQQTPVKTPVGTSIDYTQGLTLEMYFNIISKQLDAEVSGKTRTPDDAVKAKILLKAKIKEVEQGLLAPEDLPDWENADIKWASMRKREFLTKGKQYGNQIVEYQGQHFDLPNLTPIPKELAEPLIANIMATAKGEETTKELRLRLASESKEASKEREARFQKEREYAGTLWQKQAELAETKRQFDISSWKVQPQLSYEQEAEMRAGLFENARQAGLKGASNWIDRWRLQHQQNPYTQRASTIYNRGWDVQQAREQAQNIAESPEGWEPNVSPSWISGIGEVPTGQWTYGGQEREALRPSVSAIKSLEKIALAESRLASVQSGQGQKWAGGYAPAMVSSHGGAGGGMSPSYAGMEREPPEPEVPDWARGLIPGKDIPWFGRRVTTAGERELPMPNMRTFASLTPTQQEIYADYLDWNAENVPSVDEYGKAIPNFRKPPRLEDMQNQWRLTYAGLRNPPSGERWRVSRQI